VVKVDDARVGNGDAEHVAGEVAEHGIFTLTPARDLDDPRLGPDDVRDLKVGALVSQKRLELAANELGECHRWGEKGFARWVPVTAIGRGPATGDKTMHVRMVKELLRPGVKNSKNTDRAADEAGISSDVDDRLGRRLHQHGITVTLIGAQEGPQLLR